MSNITTKNISFDKLNLKNELLEGLYLHGFKSPSPIQIKGIQSINTGRDCILQSQSGTGKTATYLLGFINKLEKNNLLQGIIISPTRELSEQVFKVAIILSKRSKVKISRCIGGTYINHKELSSTNLIIGTIGRINHMISENIISIKNIKFIVIDEADDMLTSEIKIDIENIISLKPENCQTCLISATLSQNVFKLSKKLLDNPIKVLLKKNEIAVELIKQFYLDVEIEEYKFDVLLDLYNILSSSQSIIFCNTIRKVNWLTEHLKEKNFPITSIHGKMTQKERNDIVSEFREGKTRLLLTTDLLSRGIDIPQVNLVINYDIPPNKETYIHRIGRCGRFGKKGISITMIKMDDSIDLKLYHQLKNYYDINIQELPDDIEKYLN